MKKILITGITGQAGAILAEQLVNEYQVFGLVRRTSSINTVRINHLLDKITLIPGDLLDLNSLIRAIKQSDPWCVVNLAAQSFVHISWDQPILTSNVTGLGAVNVIIATRMVNPDIRFIQASSSEMYGLMKNEEPLNEVSEFHPRSPYACSKIFAHYMTINARESYGMWACCPIMFNYESHQRSPEFVTRKITRAAARIKMGLQKELRLGNLSSRRDWSACQDTCRAIRLLMEKDVPDEYVIASGEAHSVREFCQEVFEYLDLDYDKYVVVDPDLFRPAEVPLLLGCADKAKKELGWEPEINFKQLVKMMVDVDIERCKQGDWF